MSKRTVWKYELPLGYSTISMPVGAKPLHVDSQGSCIFVWCLVDPELQLEERAMAVVGTGHVHDMEDLKNHIGTLKQGGGALIWHVFDLGVES